MKFGIMRITYLFVEMEEVPQMQNISLMIFIMELEMSANRTKGVRVEALTSNSGIVTCLANDIGYENILVINFLLSKKR